MRVKWAVLLSSASLLLGSTSASAQGPLTLSGAQLDGVLPTYQYDPSRYQVRVAIEPVTVADPDRVRDALLMAEDPEANMAAQQLPEQEPQCTPARRALLAVAGRSESSAWDAGPQGTPALASTAAPIRPSANRADSRFAAANSLPDVVGDPTSSAQAGWSSGRPVASDADASRRAPEPKVAGDAGRRALAPKVEAPIRTARSDKPARPSGAGAVRSGRGADAADIVARVRSEVSRTLSALPGGAFRLN